MDICILVGNVIPDRRPAEFRALRCHFFSLPQIRLLSPGGIDLGCRLFHLHRPGKYHCPGPPEVRIQCPAISNENQLSHKDFVLSISPLVCYIVLAAICNNKQKEGFFMSSQPQKPHPPQAPPSSPETWITAAEAAAALHLSLRTVLSRAASGKLPAKIADPVS